MSRSRSAGASLLLLSALIVTGFADTTRVACVGNSITEGWSAGDPSLYAYPAQLGQLLGDNYEIRNFGVSAKCVLKRGDDPYWADPGLDWIFEFEPHIVTIMLGTNDSKSQNWVHKDRFDDDLGSMIDTFLTMEHAPDIWLCLPPPKFTSTIYKDIDGTVIHEEIVPIVSQVAALRQVSVIDTHTPLLDSVQYFPDGVHPDADGCAALARLIFEAMTSSSTWSDQLHSKAIFTCHPTLRASHISLNHPTKSDGPTVDFLGRTVPYGHDRAPAGIRLEIVPVKEP